MTERHHHQQLTAEWYRVDVLRETQMASSPLRAVEACHPTVTLIGGVRMSRQTISGGTYHESHHEQEAP